MAFNLIIKPIVWFDLEEAIDWYENKNKGLGKKFFASFEDATNQILLQPNAYKAINKEVRRIITKNFPYKILYIVTGNDVYIIGLMHTKRSNTFIRRRLK